MMTQVILLHYHSVPLRLTTVNMRTISVLNVQSTSRTQTKLKPNYSVNITKVKLKHQYSPFKLVMTITGREEKDTDLFCRAFPNKKIERQKVSGAQPGIFVGGGKDGSLVIGGVL
jgi:hypothetical protein